jgi:hypothetical protein
LKREIRLAVNKVRAIIEVRFIVILKAKVVRILILKFNVYKRTLYNTITSHLSYSTIRYKRFNKNKMGQKGKKAEKEVALPNKH